jgi:hypothetical protein
MIYDLMTLLICSRFRLPNFSSYFRCNQSDLAFSSFHACCLEAQVAGEVNETREKAIWKDFVIFRAIPLFAGVTPLSLSLMPAASRSLDIQLNSQLYFTLILEHLSSLFTVSVDSNNI